MEKIKKFQWGGYTVLGHENDGFEESSKSAANTFNFVMGKMGKAFTKLLATQAVPTGSATGSSVYTSSPSYRYNLTHAAPAAEKVIEDNAVYVSPSSHVAAWFQGSWDPKIGAQYLASDPRLQALGIMGDVAAFKYAPKVVKATPKTVINAAAKAGSKTAKKAVIAREINQATKNNNIKTPFRYITKDYNYNDDGSVSSIMYQLHDPISGKPLGNGVISSSSGTKGRPVGWIESQNGARGVSEDIYNVAVEDAKTYGDPGIESGWDLMEPQKTLAVTRKFPHIVVGESEGNPVRLLTGTTNKQQPHFIQQSNHHLENNNIKYNLKTGNFEEKNPNAVDGNKLSLKFFERRPSRISLAERMGIPKGDRGNLNIFQKQGLQDLEQYINSGQYRQLPTINMETGEPFWVSRNGNISALKQLIDDGVPSSGRLSWAWNRPNGGTYELITNGDGNFGIGYTSYRMFDVAPEFNARMGEASAGSARNGYSKIFLTAPKNEVIHFIAETPEQELAKASLIKTQSPRISKDIMRDFWSGVQQSLRPGAYLSGDEGMLPKGATLIRQFKEFPKKAYRRNNNGEIIGSGRTTWEDIRNSLMRREKWKKREMTIALMSHD